MGEIISILGAVVITVGAIWLLVVAFQESILWGLGCLFIPIVGLVFLIMHWSAAWKPFVVQLAGSALLIIGAVLKSQASV